MLSSVLLPFNKPALASQPSSYSTLSLKPLSFLSMMKGTDGNAGDTGSIPGLGRSPEKEMAIHSSTIAWKIPWTDEPSGIYSP